MSLKDLMNNHKIIQIESEIGIVVYSGLRKLFRPNQLVGH